MHRDLDDATPRRERGWLRNAAQALFAVAVLWTASSVMASYLEAVPAWFAGGRARGIEMLLWIATFVLWFAVERWSRAGRDGGPGGDAAAPTLRKSGCTTTLFVVALVGICLDVVPDAVGWLGDPSDHDLWDLWLLVVMVVLFADHWQGRGSAEGRGPR